MYRDSVTDFLVLCKPGNPTANATEKRLHTFGRLVECKRLSSSEDAPAGFWRFSAQNRGLVGDVRLKSGEHLLLFLLL